MIALRFCALYYVDWLWFGEVSLRTVFWTRVKYGLVLGPLFGGAFFALVYGNVEVARRMAPKYRAFEGIDVIEYVHEDASRRVHQIALVLTALVAVLLGFAAARSWLVFARAFSSTAFDIKDPVFHHDLSFYVFTLPAWQYVYSFLFATLIVALIATATVHLALGGVELRGLVEPPSDARRPSLVQATALLRQIRRVRVHRNVVAHLSALLAALFILGGLGYLLKAWNLLYSTAGVVFGAGYTDVHVRLPLIRVLMVLGPGRSAPRSSTTPCAAARTLWPPDQPSASGSSPSSSSWASCRPSGSRSSSIPTSSPRRLPTSPATSPPHARPTT